ncbi:30S ribosomal protein S20 [Natroniella acetigena]|uniref:30S ribosomal protein S20 n=1 Tax=Natroniella acetigena TaxID=52004 RepID=UPI00200A82AF|nr:30S ribosomal protein S20 [Natroniella acetigena]MCK8826962.1 30S ribosomal protein S20 [Natroniella acetigena]
MPTSKSAKKRVRVTEKKTKRNRQRKEKVKIDIKEFEEAVTAGNVELAEEKLKEAKKTIDKFTNKGLFHKNTAARKKSKLDRKFNKLTA